VKAAGGFSFVRPAGRTGALLSGSSIVGVSLPYELIRQRPRPIRHNIASVFCRHCFNQHDPAFLVGDRIVQDAFGYNAEFPWKHGHLTPSLELDHEASLDNLKELVFVIVFVPHELAL
jgi:hypothetical protein